MDIAWVKLIPLWIPLVIFLSIIAGFFQAWWVRRKPPTKPLTDGGGVMQEQTGSGVQVGGDVHGNVTGEV